MKKRKWIHWEGNKSIVDPEIEKVIPLGLMDASSEIYWHLDREECPSIPESQVKEAKQYVDDESDL